MALSGNTKGIEKHDALAWKSGKTDSGLLIVYLAFVL